MIRLAAPATSRFGRLGRGSHDDVFDAFKLGSAAAVAFGGEALAKCAGTQRRLRAETRDQECGSLMIVRTVHLI
jgi:hypothetical protein